MCATASAVVLPRQFLSGMEVWAEQMETTLNQTVQCADQGMGHLEEPLVVGTQELQRQALERAAQAKADATPPRCPICGRESQTTSKWGHISCFCKWLDGDWAGGDDVGR